MKCDYVSDDRVAALLKRRSRLPESSRPNSVSTPASPTSFRARSRETNPSGIQSAPFSSPFQNQLSLPS